MCSDSEFIFVPQTSKIVMEINFSVIFKANNLISKQFLNLTSFKNIYSSDPAAGEQTAPHPFNFERI